MTDVENAPELNMKNGASNAKSPKLSTFKRILTNCDESCINCDEELVEGGNRTGQLDGKSPSDIEQSCVNIEIGSKDKPVSEEKACGEDASSAKERLGERCSVEKSNLPEPLVISKEELLLYSPEQLWEVWQQQTQCCEALHARVLSSSETTNTQGDAEDSELKELERLKPQLTEAQRKEAYHLMRLASKDHELQDVAASVSTSKSLTVARCSLLDPAVNLCIEHLKQENEAARNKAEEAQNELAAWKFTPDSNTGKQLMAKCRALIKENEELGRSDKLAKLEGDLALQRNFTEELKKSQTEMDEFLLEMDEDTEGMQGTIMYLQEQLRLAKQQNSANVAGVLATEESPGASSHEAPVDVDDAAEPSSLAPTLEENMFDKENTNENGDDVRTGNVTSTEDAVKVESVSETECRVPSVIEVEDVKGKRNEESLLSEIESLVIPHSVDVKLDLSNLDQQESSLVKEEGPEGRGLVNGGKKRTRDDELSALRSDEEVVEPLCKRTKVSLLDDKSESIEDFQSPRVMENGVEQ